MPNVNFRRGELNALSAKYQLIRDCIAGAERVREQGDVYLPRPNAADKSPQNLARFEAYLARAVFYAVARNTLDGLVGQVFASEPTVEMPDAMSVLLDNADGAGVGLTQMAKKALSAVTALGRYSLFVDYPSLENATRQDQIDGIARPTIVGYDTEAVINWRTTSLGAKTMLSLVVIEEQYGTHDDGFEVKFEPQWRTLWLDVDGNYKVEIYRKKQTAIGSSIPSGFNAMAATNMANASEGDFYLAETYVPLDGAGAAFREIPFQFVGSLNNDWNPDTPPLYGLCVLNMAHYRNSADYEESCFLVGQPTVWASGLTKDWVDNVLGKDIEFGSRAVLALPRDGAAGILQAVENTMPMEAMLHKEKQMVAIGAKLVENRDVQRTLGEAQMDNAAETSNLSTIAKNTGAAFEQALRWCAQFYGITVTDDNIKYILSTDFAIQRMPPLERAQLLAEWQGDGITWKEYRNQLRQSGVATEDDDEAKEEIADEAQKRAKLAMDDIVEDPLNPDKTDPTNNDPTED